MRKMRVAILGTGNIGSDLLVKVRRSANLECRLFAGRRPDSPGMARAKALGVPVSARGISAVLENPDVCDLVIDATSAEDHRYNWSVLKDLGKFVIDMTPSRLGKMVVPAVNLEDIAGHQNVNMVSCGGQASLPLIYTLAQSQNEIEYIEVVSSIASRSAGPATRINIDEYVETTEEGIRFFSGCARVKAVLILNPAEPCIDMQTTISIKVKEPDMMQVQQDVSAMEGRAQAYVPGYRICVPPTYETNRIVTMVRTRGLGDYLPSYAGNLDIINCAAIATAQAYAKQQAASAKSGGGAKHYV